MPRRFFLRTTESDATGFTAGVSKSFALDQAINNQPIAAVNPVVFYGGELTPRVLSPERGQLSTGTSLSVDPYGLYPDDQNLRGFLTHFITPPQKEQHLRAGFTRIALKAKHDSALSTAQLEASIYIVDSAGAVVSFLWDKDKAISAALVADETTAGVALVMMVPTVPGDIPALGRVAAELWVRHTPDEYNDLETVGAEVFLEGSDESFRPTVGGSGEYDVDSVASFIEFPQVLELADDEPVFAVRIDPIAGMKHSRIWSTDVITRDDSSEQRTRVRRTPNHLVEFTGVGHGGGAGPDEMQLMDALIERLSDRAVWLPWWRDEQSLPSTLAASATTLSVATAGYAFRDGGLAIIWQTPFVWEVVTIVTVGDGSLDIATGLAREWIAGTASIMPLKDAVMIGALKEDRQATDFATVQLAFVLTSLAAAGEGSGEGGGGEESGGCLAIDSGSSTTGSMSMASKIKGDNFSAWTAEPDQYADFFADTADNPNYEDGVTPSGTNNPAPATFWERNFDWDTNAFVVNRNRIGQLAVSGGHRTIKAIKMAEDGERYQFGFEIEANGKVNGYVFDSLWAVNRFKFSENFAVYDSDDPNGRGIEMIDCDGTRADFLASPRKEFNAGIYNYGYYPAFDPQSYGATEDILLGNMSYSFGGGGGSGSYQQNLGTMRELIFTGTERELILYAGAVFDEDGLKISGWYRMAVWIRNVGGSATKLMDHTLTGLAHPFRTGDIAMFRATDPWVLKPAQGDVMCYECGGWKLINGNGFDIDGHWDPLGLDELTAPTRHLATLSITPDPFSVAEGDTQAMTAAGLDQVGDSIATGTLTWASSDTGVATVDSSGVVTGVAAGSCTITATRGAVVSNAAACTVTEVSAGYALIATTVAAPGASGGSTSAIDTTGAALIVVVVSSYAGASGPFTVSDNKGNTWTARTSQSNGTVERVQTFYTFPTTVGTGHTFDYSVFGSYPVITVMAFSAGSPAYESENAAGNTSSATSQSTGSVTPPVDGCLVIAGVCTGGDTFSSPSIDNGFTIAGSEAGVSDQNMGGGAAYLIQETAAAVNPAWSWTGSAANEANITVFSP